MKKRKKPKLREAKKPDRRKRSPEEWRAVRQAIRALSQRVEIMSDCGESPTSALEGIFCDLRANPALLAEWLPCELDEEDDSIELLRTYRTTVWCFLFAIKCTAGIRIAKGEEAQTAMKGTIGTAVRWYCEARPSSTSTQ